MGWTMYIECLLDKKFTKNFIEKVEYKLHETFKPNNIICDKYPFEISRIGWGYFDIPIKIYFKAWTGIKPMKLSHLLRFSNGGKFENFFIDLEEEVLKKNANEYLNKIVSCN